MERATPTITTMMMMMMTTVGGGDAVLSVLPSLPPQSPSCSLKRKGGRLQAKSWRGQEENYQQQAPVVRVWKPSTIMTTATTTTTMMLSMIVCMVEAKGSLPTFVAVVVAAAAIARDQSVGWEVARSRDPNGTRSNVRRRLWRRNLFCILDLIKSFVAADNRFIL